MIKILLVTNETLGEGEDSFLASLLKDDFIVELYDVSQDIPSDCTNFDIFYSGMRGLSVFMTEKLSVL